MGLFGKQEPSEDKVMKRAQKMIEKNHLDTLDKETLGSVNEIAYILAGSQLTAVGTALQGEAEESAKISLLRAQIDQNWIIIRQLDKITKLLESK